MKNIFDINQIEQKEIEYNDLIDYIYFKNDIKKHKIVLQIDEINNTKELFHFCLDLFFKGLVKLNDENSKSVILNEISLEHIQNVIDKLSYTGICTLIYLCKENEMDNNHTSNDDEMLKSKKVYDILSESVETMKYKEYDKLSDYSFNMKIGDDMYMVKFDLKI